jgi:hypothetical protein
VDPRPLHLTVKMRAKMRARVSHIDAHLAAAAPVRLPAHLRIFFKADYAVHLQPSAATNEHVPSVDRPIDDNDTANTALHLQPPSAIHNDNNDNDNDDNDNDNNNKKGNDSQDDANNKDDNNDTRNNAAMTSDVMLGVHSLTPPPVSVAASSSQSQATQENIHCPLANHSPPPPPPGAPPLFIDQELGALFIDRAVDFQSILEREVAHAKSTSWTFKGLTYGGGPKIIIITIIIGNTNHIM